VKPQLLGFCAGSLLLGCTAAAVDERHDWGPTRVWDEAPAAPDCSLDGNAPLLDEVLDYAGLERDAFQFLDEDWDNRPPLGRPVTDDAFLLPLHPLWRDAPLRAGCNVAGVTARLDVYSDSDHGLAGSVREAAAMLDRAVEDPPLDPASTGSRDFAAALAGLCEIAGSDCEPDGVLPELAGWELVPVFDAIAHALETRYRRDERIEWSEGSPEEVFERGGNHILPHPDGSLEVNSEEVQDFLRSRSRATHSYRAAARLLFALEHADWSVFSSDHAIDWQLETEAGLLRIGGLGDDSYELPEGQLPEDLLFMLELGGDDEYRIPAGANTSAQNGVSVLVDLNGNDFYGYEEVSDHFDFLLPADEAGRFGPSQDFPNARQSLSRQGRQGAGLYGYGILFDLGGGDDSYRSLRMSQGYGHVGVGVLHDDGGDDSYECEAGCQGAGQWGIGLLVDRGGGDSYSSIAYSQGFSWVGGAGLLIDAGGDDRYDCAHGHPDFGGTPGIYPSAQMPATANSSFCQGAGFGARMDSLSGGVGMLRDRGGDDSYSAGVFAQGTGYWQGTGVLADGGGSDVYDAFWYVQGGAAHYALGILVDEGTGDDFLNQQLPPRGVMQGSGHDFSTGVLINEQGDDRYRFSSLGMGASNCNGIGLAVDNGGDDHYSSDSRSGWGLGNHSGECIESRPRCRSMGVMIDAGGSDSYEAPESDPAGFIRPENDSAWGYRVHNNDYEHGGGIDGSGDSGVHAGE
tara:strand:+ start:387 stop:2609 length:2223 start_codon:yes stop_codon:yes gene_type:complete